jgi:hypothetical protein
MQKCKEKANENIITYIENKNHNYEKASSFITVSSFYFICADISSYSI